MCLERAIFEVEANVLIFDDDNAIKQSDEEAEERVQGEEGRRE